MDLYIYPQAANNLNGYSIGVEAAYQRQTPKEDDIVVWMTTYPKKDMWHLRGNDYIIKYPSKISWRSILNLISLKWFTVLSVGDLNFLTKYKFDNIICDEEIFYPALRKLFPNNKISVRFHNCYARIYDRLKLLDRKVDFKYYYVLHCSYRLERQIMRDENVFKIFISDEDRNYYTSHFGIKSDSEVFEFLPNMDSVNQNRIQTHFDNRLIWFGGVESHKKSSIEWFINSVFPKVKKQLPNIEFHLWGARTTMFDNPEKGVYGHGFFDGNGMPSYESLYVNPDIIGGGIKLKLLSLLENGIPFISTPFGFEGYNYDLVDNKYCFVVEENKWAEFIVDFLQNKYKSETISDL